MQLRRAWHWYAGEIRVPTLWDAAHQAELLWEELRTQTIRIPEPADGAPCYFSVTS
jgi:hypothetical protein